MEHRYSFTEAEADRIRDLLRQKCAASKSDQKKVRQELRDIGFYISDFGYGFTVDGFNRLIDDGSITVGLKTRSGQW